MTFHALPRSPMTQPALYEDLLRQAPIDLPFKQNGAHGQVHFTSCCENLPIQNCGELPRSQTTFTLDALRAHCELKCIEGPRQDRALLTGGEVCAPRPLIQPPRACPLARPLACPQCGLVHGPLYGPSHVPLYGPLHAPLHGPLHGPLHVPLYGPSHVPLYGPLHAPCMAPWADAQPTDSTAPLGEPRALH